MGGVDNRTYTQVDDTQCAVPIIGDLVINEILANPEGNETSTQDEWIEIVNQSSLPIYLEGLELFYRDTLRLSFGSLCLPPQSALTLFNQQPPTFWMWSTPFIGDLETQPLDEFTLVNSANLQLELRTNEGVVLSGWDSSSNLIRSGVSLNRSPDLDLNSDPVLHTSLPEGNGSSFSPGRCPNGFRYEDQCSE